VGVITGHQSALLVPIGLLGLVCGSYLNVVISRLPRGEGTLSGRSRCPECRHVLGWRDLVPVASYLLLRGRCRYCGARISLQYPAVEICTATVFILLFWRFGLSPVLAKYLFLGGLLVAASFIDLEHYIIPDGLIVAGLAGGAVLGLAAHDVGFWSALAGLAVGGGALLLVALASRGGMGGGDVKLAAVTGLFLGWPLGPLGLFFGVCLGGVVAAVLLALGIRGRKDPVPFGPFIAVGALLALLAGRECLEWYLRALG
jgi:leader peptidase (prepilin peptidase)/N-methyltransferase